MSVMGSMFMPNLIKIQISSLSKVLSSKNPVQNLWDFYDKKKKSQTNQKKPTGTAFPLHQKSEKAKHGHLGVL